MDWKPAWRILVCFHIQPCNIFLEFSFTKKRLKSFESKLKKVSEKFLNLIHWIIIFSKWVPFPSQNNVWITVKLVIRIPVTTKTIKENSIILLKCIFHTSWQWYLGRFESDQSQIRPSKYLCSENPGNLHRMVPLILIFSFKISWI